MILIDRRIGSADLLAPLQAQHLPAELTELPFGDVAFTGQGEHDVPVFVGIELKELPDLLQCLRDGRFSGHQLPGLLHDYDFVFLVVEGPYRANKESGVLEVLRRGGWEPSRTPIMASAVDGFLLTLTLRAGVIVLPTDTRLQTVQCIKTLYWWFNGKEFEEHKSHVAMYSGWQVGRRDPAILIKPSLCRRWARELSGIGVDKSKAVANHFGHSARRMCNASDEEWLIPGVVGKALAKKIQEELT